MSKFIPLSVPNLKGNEWKYVKECIDTNWVSSVGSYVNRFEDEIKKFVGAKYAVATVNGTSALHVALKLAEVDENTCVVVPNITFIATANAVSYCNAEIILCDVDEYTWQIDLDLLEEYFENKTFCKNNVCYRKSDNKKIGAIIPVHVLGNMCDMNRLQQLAQKYNVSIIEDAAESLGSIQNGKHAATFGIAGAISFNGNKIITSGGGGMIVTNDESFAQKAKHITTQAKSDSFEYIHDEIGYNYRLVNILAALGVAQLEQLPEFLNKKNEIASYYTKELSEINDISFQKISENTKANNWLFTIRTRKDFKGLVDFLTENEIQVRPLWKPMNQLNMFSCLEYISNKDISGVLYNECISLPCSTSITQHEIKKVVDAIKTYYSGAK